MAQNWFKHDYNARNDDDILELRAEYGWKGYGLFYAFIETMAENEKGAIDIDKIGGLSVGFNLPKEELIAFVETCLKIGLFTKDQDGFIRNNRITKHVNKMNAFKEAGKKGAKKRWSNDSDKGANRGAINGGNATPNADKTREDKIRKDNKEHVEPDGSDAFPDICEYLDEAESLAKHLLDRIIEWKPDHKYARNKPALQNWILEIERAIRLDGRDPEALKGLIDYTFTKETKQAQFWAKNIWSGKKLRDKYDRLVSDYKDEQKSRNNGSTNTKSRADRSIETAREIINKFQSENAH